MANRVLLSLPAGERDAVLGAGTTIPLKIEQVLQAADRPIDAVYFPHSCVASLVIHFRDGRSVEYATVGREGVVGLPVFWGATTMPGQTFIQVAGEALKVPARAFARLATQNTTMHNVLHRYAQALFTQVAQGSACNRAHSIVERCARWILMTHDRVGSDTFSLTQEFLAQMIGVRRGGVSAAAGVLQRAGYISYARGTIQVRDRAGLQSAACECYEIVRNELDRLVTP